VRPGRLVAVLAAGVLAGCGSSEEPAQQSSTVRGYRVPSEAMIPTLRVGAHIRVDTGAYEHARPRVGEVVVFHPPRGANLNECGAAKPVDALCARPTPDVDTSVTFVKRIVAGPGDRVRLVSGIAIVNGLRFHEENHIRGCGRGDECSYRRAVKVPAGHWFVLGDNRGASDDSRFWGPIRTEWIIGKVLGV
jgi:signal peptidase I